MDDVKATIVATLDANGGKCTWQQMLDAVGFEGRKHITNAMASLKSENIAIAQNRYSAEEGAVFEIVKVS